MKDRACSLGIIRRKEHKTQFCIPLSPVFTRDCGDGLNFIDEATAYIDPENEAIVQKAVAKLVKEKTVIVIAHRLSTITDADQIFVVADGRISASGTHEELLKQSAMYHEMWQAHIGAKDGDAA